MVSLLLPLNNGLSKTDQSVSAEFVHYSPFLSSLSLILFKSHPYSLHLQKDIPFPILFCVLASHDHVRLTCYCFCVSLPPTSTPGGYDAWSSSCLLAAGGESQENSRVPTHTEMLKKLWDLLPLHLHEMLTLFHCFNLASY